MEHFEMPAGELVVTNPRTTKSKLYALDFVGRTPRGELAVTPAAQKEFRVLNGTTAVEAGSATDKVVSTFQFIDTALITAERLGENGGRKGVPPIPVKAMGISSPISGPPSLFRLTSRQEQAPNPNSRVTLSTEKDAL